VPSFFEKNRASLRERGIDPDRLPPGQYFTERFPVLHVGDVPQISPESWDLSVFGLVRAPRHFTLAELRSLPRTTIEVDIHCVTKWSKFDTHWEGVLFRDLLAAVDPDPLAAFVVEHAEHGYTTNLPLADLMGDDTLIAWAYEGAPIEPQHGGPVRMVVPARYFWKSAKWLRGIELVAHDQPGFWEQNGYHNVGDPWREERYWGD
jgi:DMSO/TMAO reductase YedYZ molybdopterin-dependent catalytic subunit